MASASVVGQPWIENGLVCMAARVGGDALDGRAVEYVGRVPFTPGFQALSDAQKKALLVAAVKAARDAQVTAAPSAPTITGSVTI